ncbi:hypothetical protein FEL89_23510, partial [Salmonella enterica]|nr:hypothetical protein [Salmonella enterica]
MAGFLILTNKELLKTLLNNFNNIEKEVWVYDTDLKSFTTREVDLLDYDLPSAIATLLGKVEGAIMPAWRVLREIVCRISGCKSTEFAQRHGREGIKLMGQK